MATATRPATGEVPTLPGRYYYDPAIFALEQERIFASSWFCIGRADQLPAAGDYLLVTIAGESVIVLRDRAGEVRAFLNVCRHRGARLCTEERGQLKNTIQCHYHAWTYALDGHLVGAPNMRDDPAFDPTTRGLHPVALQLWEGLLFLNLSDAPGDLLDQGADNPHVARYNMARLAVGGSMTYDVKANWKIIIANYEECAHCALVHPELSEQVPIFKSGWVGGDDGAELGPGVESLTPTGKRSRPPLPGLLPADLHRYYGMVIRPNLFVDLHPDYAITSVLWPEGPAHTRIVSTFLFDPDAVAQPDFDPSDAMSFNDLVTRQDNTVCELNQQGVTSRGFRDGGVYGPNERHIRAFDDYVLARLGHAQAEAASW